MEESWGGVCGFGCSFSKKVDKTRTWNGYEVIMFFSCGRSSVN